MTVESLCTRPATLVTVTDGATDAYGNATETETTSSVLCELQQQRRDETGEPGVWQVGTYRVFFPKGTEVHGADRLVVDGDTYDFEGPPWKVWNPRTGTFSHWEATVKIRS